MIKIEKISATKATIERNGLRQPLLLHSHVSEQELASIEAEDGIIVYSVDESVIKEVTFQPKPAPVAPAPKAVKPAIVKPAAKAAEPIVEPQSPEAAAE